MSRLPWKQGAKELGLGTSEFYNGLRSGKYPGMLVGQKRGRWIVDTELVKARIEELMLANVKNGLPDDPLEALQQPHSKSTRRTR